MSIRTSPADAGATPAPSQRRRTGQSATAVVQSLALGDGRTLCVRRWGTGSDPVVILHGLLDSSEGWNRMCQRLAVPGIAFDLPGFGHSDPAPRGSIAGYARDVTEGLAMLGVERFTLVGHSLGGAIAAALADAMPERIGALVLLAPAGFGRIHLAEAASIPGVRNVLQAALPLVLSNRIAVTAGYFAIVTNRRGPEREIVERVVDRGGELVAGAREATRAVINAGRSHTAFHRRRLAYDGPVYTVWGSRDRLVPPSHRHGVAIAFPQASISVWSGMGHHPVGERFDDLLALIRAAVADARPARGTGTEHRRAGARKAARTRAAGGGNR